MGTMLEQFDGTAASADRKKKEDASKEVFTTQ